MFYIAYYHKGGKPAIMVIFFITNLIVILQWGKKGGEGEGEVEIVHMCVYMLLPV